MKLGIIGLPNSGKTTIFNALTNSTLPTGAATSGQFEVHTAVVQVPDARVDKLKSMYNPKKTTYTQMTYVDIGGLDKGIGEGGLKGQFRNELASLDGFIHVVRAFQDESVPHPYDTVDARRDVETLDSEFILTDLVSIETRLERLETDLKRKGKAGDIAMQAELDMLNRLKAQLEAEQPLRDLGLTEDEIKPLRGFGFLTLKPVMIVANTDESNPNPTIEYTHQLSKVVSLQGKIEAELAQLEPEDAAIFMEEYGISELSAARIIGVSYDLMQIQSFYTVGEDEVRAWTIPVGATAVEAASAIHTDLAKGFVRAEVVSYDNLIKSGGMYEAKTAGVLRLEGKEYVVQDGDIAHIRSSI